MGQAGYSEEADGALPLCATTWGDDKLLRAALAGRRGGPPPCHGWRGRTRLMAACHFGRLPRVSLLLSNGAPLEQRDAFGGTAMAAAVVAGRSAVVSALRSAGAGPYTPLTGTASSTLKGHTITVWALAVLSDGRLASASWDKTIRVWRPSTGVCEAVLEGHTITVWALAVLPDGRLASGSADKTVRVWS
jgi:ankyrin repeat protein